MSNRPGTIIRAANDVLVDEEGREWIDLFAGTGTVVVGHANPVVNQAICRQSEKVMAVGMLKTDARVEAEAAIERCLPGTLGLVQLYSTGMEASEVAIRLARSVTGKRGIVGFNRGMHGKSQATAFLSWDNRDGVEIRDLYRLPYLDTLDREDQILAAVEGLFRRCDIASLFVEPVQGVGGGYRGSAGFYLELRRLCTAHAVLLVFDEILTGFYRTGSLFYFSRLGLTPDILLFGKALGNGFPISGIAMARRYLPVKTPFGLSSTFASNPLACAAAVATLSELQRIDAGQRVATIEMAFARSVAGVTGVVARIHGAMCVLQFADAAVAERVHDHIGRQGFYLSVSGPYVRFLPPYTLTEAHLAQASAAIATAMKECQG